MVNTEKEGQVMVNLLSRFKCVQGTGSARSSGQRKPSRVGNKEWRVYKGGRFSQGEGNRVHVYLGLGTICGSEPFWRFASS